MKRHIAGVLILLSFFIAMSAWAGWEEGLEAYKRGDNAAALREWKPLAEQGVVVAQYNLGQMYLRGQGVPQDYAQAMQWFRRAADQGHAEAQASLGGIYTNGWGVPQDYAQAVQWFRRAADQGNVYAQLNLFAMYYYGWGVPQDYAQAVPWVRRVAEQGNADAQYMLGTMYDNGQGVPQDDAQAAFWFYKAAAQGSEKAQYSLGQMYLRGQGVPQDYAQAMQWFRRAADQGHAEAQHNLGVMYGKGQGVPQDYTQAYFWLNLAAARLPVGFDRDTAVKNRNAVAARLTPTQLASAQAQARNWQPKSETLSAQADLPVSSTLPQVSTQGSPVSSPPRRDLIRQVQQRLQAQGFSPGAIDGSLGPQTQKALRWFQNSKGLLPSGELDEKTLDALGVQ